MPSSDRIFGRLRPDTARPPTGADVGTSGAGAAVHPAPSGSVLQGRRLGALPYPGDAGDAAKVATTSANGAAGRPLSLPGRDGYPGTAGDADPDGSTPALEAASLRELVRRAEARGYEGGLARGQAELRVAIQAAGALAAQIEAMAPSEKTSRCSPA